VTGIVKLVRIWILPWPASYAHNVYFWSVVLFTGSSGVAKCLASLGANATQTEISNLNNACLVIVSHSIVVIYKASILHRRRTEENVLVVEIVVGKGEGLACNKECEQNLPQDFSVLVEVDLLEAVGQRLLSILENEVHELVLVGGVGQVGGALGGGTAVRRQETRLH